MEFPPEIVDLIRRYSEPCFKYFREYKRILRLSGRVSWPLLKEGLSKDGKVLPRLLAYEKALIEWGKMSCRHATQYTHYFWGDARLSFDELYRSRQRARTKALNDLVSCLVSTVKSP